MDYAQRREKLLASLTRPLLLAAGGFISRNYPANLYPFRADSTFHYFFEAPEAEAVALFDPEERGVTLFLPERTVEDAIWHGALESFEAAQARHGVARVLGLGALEAEVAARARGRQVDALAVADHRATARLRALTGQALSFEIGSVGRDAVLQAIAGLRLTKDADEVRAMRRTAEVTLQAHLAAMRHSKPGVTEQRLAGEVEGAFAREGCVPAYQTILSVRGEVLHNHAHRNTLAAGDIVLLDAGAESADGYCSDVTRCWPVGGAFTAEGRAVYETVLAANLAAIAAVKPGVHFRDVHFTSARVVLEGLKALGLVRGSVEALLESGAHAVFYPHGVGHQLGLDVHDVEAFGDLIHYPGAPRSDQFGTRNLRMDMPLAEGMTFTIEPGIYFVPELLRGPQFRARFAAQIDFARAEQFLQANGGRGFGGIRIEDDLLCTSSGCEVLTAAIPKGAAQMEALAGSGPA